MCFSTKKDIIYVYTVRYYFMNAFGRVRSSVDVYVYVCICALCNIIIIYTRPDLIPIYRACKYFVPPHRDTSVCLSLFSVLCVHLSCYYYRFNIITIIVGVQF